MADLVLQPQRIRIEERGTLYVPHIYGIERADGTWEAWIEFTPVGTGALRTTDRETTQPNRAAVEYWASGLEPTYWEGAFSRSVPLPR
jgi:hypothetical protein